MEERRDPLEGFDWVFKPEAANPPPDMEDDSFARLFGSGPTMHDLDAITEVEPIRHPETSFLVQALREHPGLRRVAVRTSLAIGAVITGVTAAFITHTPMASTEALPLPHRTSAPQLSASPEHTVTPKIPSKERHTPAANISSPNMTPIGFTYSASSSPTFIPRMFTPTPTVSETVDATSRPPTSSAPATVTPSETCTPSVSPSVSIIETPSPVETQSPSESPTDIETTFDQTEMPQASQSPSLGG